MSYKIDEERCAACGYCMFVCPFEAIAETGDIYAIDQDKCKQCGQCYDACAAHAVDCDEGQQRVVSISIDKEKCIGCSLCSRACPVGAVTGEIKQPYEIRAERCIKCGFCLTKCKKDAIKVTYGKAKHKIKNHKITEFV